MKLKKRTGDTSTIRKVVDGGKCIGILGTVEDLNKVGIIVKPAEPTSDAYKWVFIKASEDGGAPDVSTMQLTIYVERQDLLDDIGYMPDAPAAIETVSEDHI